MENDKRLLKPITEVKPHIRSLWPVLPGLAAAVLAPGLELATGHLLPYLLVLTLLAGIVWGVWRLGRHGMGLYLGTARSHLVAFSYPILVLGALVLMALVCGSIGVQTFSVREVPGKLGLMFVSTWIGVLITEEGFFRGALWGLGERTHWRGFHVLLWTSLAFMAWHVAVPLMEEAFALPARQLPLYYGNVVFLDLS